jgi:hypothetical protein
MRTLPFALALALVAAPDDRCEAGETAETILIRQTLEKDRSGRRRGDVELMMSACHESFVTYDARGYIDPAGWVVEHESLEAREAALRAELEANRYEIARRVTFLQVWKEKAVATVEDSLWVTDRASSERRRDGETSLWTFRKLDEDWLATSLVANLGDSTAGPYSGSAGEPDADIARVLGSEAEAWGQGSAGGILDLYDDEYLGIDQLHSSNTAKILITFSDAEELEEWLDQRLELVDYDLERKVVQTTVGPEGNEAVAITEETVVASRRLGDAVDKASRRMAWALSRSGGDWKVTWALLHVKPF